MKRWCIVFIVILNLGLSDAAQAKPAKFDTLADAAIGTTSVTVRYYNIAATKKFQFQLWDKRAGRTSYRSIDSWFIKRTNKKKKIFETPIADLKSNRDYRLRYRPIYGGDRPGLWSNYLLFRTKNQSVTFNLTSAVTLATDDVPQVVMADSGPHPMTLQNDGSWSFELEGVSRDDVIQFVLSRNFLSTIGYEQFEPDDPTAWREFTVTDLPLERNVTVEQWRWFDPSVSSGTVSTDAWVVTDRDQFVVSAMLPSDYTDASDSYLVASTMQTLAEAGFNYVTIPYSARFLLSANPLTAESRSNKNTPSTEQLESILTEATSTGLTPILYLQMKLDPDNADAIANDLAGTHDTSYLTSYLTEWRQTMRDGVEFAMAHAITTVVLEPTFDTLEYSDDAQQQYISFIIANDLLPMIADGYSGILTSGAVNNDGDFSWYAASQLDWVGINWQPDLTDSLEPTMANMYTTAVTAVTNELASLNALYNKPIYLAGFTLASWDGAAGALPASLVPTNAVDPAEPINDAYPRDYQEQADAYEAAWRVVADSNFIVGATTQRYGYFDIHDTTEAIRNKPAEQVWSRWIDLFSDAPTTVLLLASFNFSIHFSR